MPPSAPATVATATHLLPFVLVAARPRRAAANAQTMPVDDGRRERCTRAAAASRVQSSRGAPSGRSCSPPGPPSTFVRPASVKNAAPALAFVLVARPRRAAANAPLAESSAGAFARVRLPVTS